MFYDICFIKHVFVMCFCYIGLLYKFYDICCITTSPSAAGSSAEHPRASCLEWVCVYVFVHIYVLLHTFYYVFIRYVCVYMLYHNIAKPLTDRPALPWSAAQRVPPTLSSSTPLSCRILSTTCECVRARARAWRVFLSSKRTHSIAKRGHSLVVTEPLQ